MEGSSASLLEDDSSSAMTEHNYRVAGSGGGDYHADADDDEEDNLHAPPRTNNICASWSLSTSGLEVEDETDNNDDEPTTIQSQTGMLVTSLDGTKRTLWARIKAWLCCCCICPGRKKATAGSSCMVVLFGQFLSFLFAATGASQATLELDCHLSAPALSVTPFYLCLALGLIPLYFCYYHGRNASPHHHHHMHHKKTDGGDGKDDDAAADVPEKQALPPQSPSRKDLIGIKEVDSPSTHAFLDEEGAAAATSPSRSFHKSSDSISSPSNPSKKFLGIIPLCKPAHIYFIVAVADFYANYFTVWAFHYTTITSVAVLDALAIPSAMILSRLWLGRSYSAYHLMGVLICMTGVLLNVYQDYLTDKSNNTSRNVGEEEAYPHKALGDVLGTLGGILFGVSNTIAEYLVRDTSAGISPNLASLEYLSMLGLFASFICIVQVLIWEADRVHNFVFFMNSDKADETCASGKAFGLWMAFSLCSLLVYVGTARFLQVSEAVYLNLSLLTGDFWSVSFSVIAEHIVPQPLFYPALLLIIGGNIVYEMTPSPVQPQGSNSEGSGGGRDNNSAEEQYVTDFQQEIELREQPQEASSVISRGSHHSSHSTWV